MNMKWIVMGLGMAGLTLALSAADYTWNGPTGDAWQDWANPANWLVDGEAATAAPSANDTVKQPLSTSGSMWKWNLGGTAVTLKKLEIGRAHV